MRVLELRAENFQRLKAIEITPTGDIVQISGKNASGKTSTLDAIWSALGGGNAQPSRPVRDGTTRAQVRVTLGDGKPELVVTRKFTASGGTSLVVEQPDGSLLRSPQKVLDELLGALTFDPLEFVRMKPKDQLDTLRTLVKLDEDVDALDKANEADFLARTDVNRRAKSLAAQADAIQVPAGLPASPPDVNSLLGEMEKAGAHNTGIERLRSSRVAVQANADRKKADAGQMRKEAARLRDDAAAKEKEADALDADAAKDEEQIKSGAALPEPIDVAAIRKKVEDARSLADSFALRDRRRQIMRDKEAEETRSDALTAAMQKRDDRKAEVIGAAKMPVPGLSFGAGEVLFNGVPFSQASSAQKTRVSSAIAKAANPRLKVVLIRDGSLLDDASMKMLAEEMAGYQCWVERVDMSGKVGVVIEDGEVAADNHERAI